MISGNHDSMDRLTDMKTFYELGQVYMMNREPGKIQSVTEEDEYGQIHIYLLPYIRPRELTKIIPESADPSDEEAVQKVDVSSDMEATKALVDSIDLNTDERNIILAHLFVDDVNLDEENEVGTLQPVSADIFEPFDYTALGHLHNPHAVKKENIRYAGSPIKYSLNEKHSNKSVTIIDMKEKGNVQITEIPLHPLRDIVEFKDEFLNFFSKEEYTSHANNDFVSFIATDENEAVSGLDRLKETYSYPLGLAYDNTKTRALSEIHPESIETKSPMDLLLDFYEKQNDAPMDENQIQLAKEIFDEIQRKDKEEE
jgi:exonuclease SbcD